MRRGTHPSLVAIALFSLVAPLPTVVAEEPPLAHLPGIARGDFWAFEVSGNAEGMVRNTVAAVEGHTGRDGKTYETYRVHAVSEVIAQQEKAGVSVPVEERLEVDKWVKTRDHGAVGINGTITIKETGRDATTRRVARYYTPPLVEDIYPFGVGSSWEVKTEVWTKQGGDDSRTEPSRFFAKVLAYEAVRVPARAEPFMAWKLEIFFDFEGGKTLRWYSDEACTTIREERYGKSASVTEPETVYVLTDHRCSHTPTEDPTYDTTQVKLKSAPNGVSGTPPVHFTEPPPSDANESVGPGVWVALAVVVGVSIALIGYGKRRSGGMR